MKSIGIIGYKGFVGNAVYEGLRHAFKVVGYDKRDPAIIGEARGDHGSHRTSIDPIAYFAEVVDGPIFVCVPTPMLSDGSCDTSIVAGVVQELDQKCRPNTVVAIKSTVVPGTSAELDAQCKNVLVCFNPEFLREATAVADFKKQDRIIVGGPHKGTKVLKQMYQIAYPDVPVTKTSSTIAEMVKYVTNCFLATKVSFANEIKQICDHLAIDYDKVIEYATKDRRLGNSHWSVPGTDGTGLCGFGLTCFPKDLNALIAKAVELGVDPKVMQSVWKKNLEVRPERDWEQLLGRAVHC